MVKTRKVARYFSSASQCNPIATHHGLVVSAGITQLQMINQDPFLVVHGRHYNG